jgi:16S rRNA (adenine1518-N6/adenine1519-N6)-dimethyltransferase
MEKLSLQLSKIKHKTLKPKKYFGQHFLKREDIAERIANSLIHTDQYNQVVEIGPGRGVLTKYLIQKPQSFIAIEVDKDLMMHLAMEFPTLHVINKDFLKVKLNEITSGEFGLIGNFPYNISTQILFKMLDNRELIPEMVGMFQKEVAERVVSKHGSKVYGVTSVLLQAFYDCEYLFTVKKEAFNPPPKVQSAVIRLTRKPLDSVEINYSLLKQVVKNTFGQRRKMLRNTLKPFFKNRNEAQLQDPFFQQRPEALSVEDFIALTKRIEAIKE